MFRVASLVGAALVVASLALISPASASGSITPTVTVTPSASPGITGPVGYGVTVTGPAGDPTPTGSVLVWDGTNTCTISSLSGGSGSCSIFEAPGSYSVNATYSGDSNYASGLGTANETVDTATPLVTVTPQSGATTGLVDYAVSVTGPGYLAVPTGSVSVADGAGGTCGISFLDDTGSGNCSIEEAAGSFTITATYSGDSNYSLTTGTASETVSPATPTVSVTPQAGATTGPVSYGVTVAGPAGAVVPTGSVTVSDGTNSCGISLASGSGSCSIAEGAGSYDITANYSSDSNYTTATGTAVETVAQGLPTVGVTPQAGATTGLVSYGVSVAGPAGAVVPTGSVTVSDGTNSCGISLVSGSGTCSIAEGAGSYSLTATYNGDSNYLGATGSADETVARATATVKGSVQAGPVAGDVTYSVSVAGSDSSIVATGTVVVSVLDFPGTAPCTISLVAGAGSCQLLENPGSYTIEFTYSGDSNYLAPAPPRIPVSVGYAPVRVTVTPSANPATAKTAGVSVIYIVQVTGSSDLPDPVGTVEVTDGTENGSCFVSSLTNGIGACSIKEAFGVYSVKAVTSGDSDYASGTGYVTEYVGTNTTTSLRKNPASAKPGKTITFTATVKSTVAAGGTPGGSVVFVIGGVAQAPEPLSGGGKASLRYTVPDNASGTVSVQADYQSSDTNTWFDSTASGTFKVK
jgi:hypothetical protein